MQPMSLTACARPAARAARTASSTTCRPARPGRASPSLAPSAHRAKRVLRLHAAEGGQGPEGESGSKEPAEDPTRPASAGRPAYDEDRQYFEQKGSSSEPEKQKSKDKPSGPGKSFGPLDGGVSGGQYGYGNVVDQAFKYLANADSFFLGGVFLVALFCALLAMGPPPSMNADLIYR